MKLSVELERWRADRPDEWKMDEFIRNAEKLESERDALEATVEALRREFQDARRTLQIIASCGADSKDAEIVDVVLDESRRWISRYDESVLKLTPQQHLRDVRAEAGRAGFIAGVEARRIALLNDEHAAIKADQYADNILQEKK